MLSNIQTNSDSTWNKVRQSIKSKFNSVFEWIKGTAHRYGTLTGDLWAQGFIDSVNKISVAEDEKQQEHLMHLTMMRNKKKDTTTPTTETGDEENDGNSSTSKTTKEDVLKEWDSFLKAQKHLIKLSEYKQEKLEVGKPAYQEEYEKQIQLYQSIMNRAHEEWYVNHSDNFSDAETLADMFLPREFNFL